MAVVCAASLTLLTEVVTGQVGLPASCGTSGSMRAGKVTAADPLTCHDTGSKTTVYSSAAGPGDVR